MDLGKLAEIADAKVHGDAKCEITGVASLASAQKGQLSFLLSSAYRQQLATTKASAIVLTESDLNYCPVNALIMTNPRLGLAKLLPLFEQRTFMAPGIHPSVVLGDRCVIGANVSVAAGCVIGNDVHIGANAVVAANTVIGDRVTVGANFHAYSNVVIYHDVVIGDDVTLHSGAVIGADGFGLVSDQGHWLKIPQLGGVVLADNVEIGANTTIDRGTLEDTVIEEGVKIDNQVQVAHNVHIGAHTVIAGCVGIAGSVHIGQHCMIGGGVCINDHVTLADKVVITGMAMVVNSIDAAGVYSSGTGLQKNREWRKSAVRFRQFDNIVRRLQQLEKEVKS